MNETDLIEYIRKSTPKGASVSLGIGDDAAVVQKNSQKDYLLKTDMIVEGVHFKKQAVLDGSGHKAVMCNVSDIVAMGGVPLFCLLSVGLPRSVSLRRAKRLYDTIRKSCDSMGIAIVGGDTVRSNRLVINVALIGEVGRNRAIRRSGAKPGDVILTSGKLGGSYASGRHLSFRPRLDESQYLTKNFHVRAMMDLSDGLAKDMRVLADASGLGFRLYEASIPRHRGATLRQALTDGEDFELLFTMSVNETTRLLKDRRSKKFTFYPIGRMLKSRHTRGLVDKNGCFKSLPRHRDHHF